MAQQITTTLIDDTDGTPAVETVPFGLDGKHYEIDLSAVNASKLRDGVADFVAAARNARPATNTRRGGAVASAAATQEEKDRRKAVREWARTQNLTVGEKGRIAQDIYDAYDAAH